MKRDKYDEHVPVYEQDCACCSVPESKCENNNESWREVSRIIHEELHR